MRRYTSALLVALLSLSLAIVATPATADGLCTLIAKEPVAQFNPQATWFAASINCSSNHVISSTVNGWRRTPGQEWQFVATHSQTTPFAVSRDTNLTGIDSFNCNKDYKTTAHFSASPGGHSASATSPIRTHTC